MHDWEARLIEALNEADPLWRDRFDNPEEAARDLVPDFPGLPTPDGVLEACDALPWSYE